MQKQIKMILAALILSSTPAAFADSTNLNQLINENYKSQAKIYKEVSRLLDEADEGEELSTSAPQRSIASFAEAVVTAIPDGQAAADMQVQLLPK